MHSLINLIVLIGFFVYLCILDSLFLMNFGSEHQNLDRQNFQNWFLIRLCLNWLILIESFIPA